MRRVVGGVGLAVPHHLYGFHSLQLSSPKPCRPFDVARDGISIGEAAAFVLLERVPDQLDGERRAAARRRRIERRLSHVGAASRRPGRQAAQCRRRSTAASLEAGRYRLHQSARHRHAQQRSRGKPGGHQRYSARPRLAARPRAPPAIRWARPARWKRSSARSRIQQRLDARRRAYDHDRPHAHGALYQGEPARAGCARAQQFIRLRRHELQPDFWPCRMKLVGLRRRHRRARAGP